MNFDNQPADKSRDHLEIRCPRLGGPVTFGYCRLFAEKDLPCWKIFDCWWEQFDVAGFLEKIMKEDDLKRLAGKKPQPKILSLVELIERTRKNLSEEKKKNNSRPQTETIKGESDQ